MHDPPLDQLTDAVLGAERLGDLRDHLVGHFVDRARRSGASWTEIGSAMGVTKQAVQKRFAATALTPEEDLQRFTARARSAVLAAQEAARAGGNPQISPEHLAHGLLADARSVAAKALGAQGVGTAAAREAIIAALPGGA